MGKNAQRAVKKGLPVRKKRTLAKTDLGAKTPTAKTAAGKRMEKRMNNLPEKSRAKGPPKVPAETARPLTTYQRKRDFTHSPEPHGREPASSGSMRSFCVQKHLASHLHYDFRLEHRGVLLSWAVPKGPSLDPRVKRLAMAVEDHPLAYGSFEGVIPRGYGAGIVLLWDTGWWQPAVDDVDAALAAGRLSFVIHSEKLTGAWTLLRLRRSGEKSWLLLKQEDPWANKTDITAAAPLSVASGGDFAAILARTQPNPWPGSPPARSGATAALFQRIIRAARELQPEPPRPSAARVARVRAPAAAARKESGGNKRSTASQPR